MELRIFLSYSHVDGSQVAEQVERILLGLNVEVERDSRFLELGADFAPEITRRIRAADALIVVVSEAVAQSQWVPVEVGIAFDLGKRIIPLVVDDTVTPDALLPYIHGRHGLKIQASLSEVEQGRLHAEFASLLKTSEIADASPNQSSKRLHPQINWVTNDQYLQFILAMGRSQRPPHWSRHAPYFSPQVTDAPVTGVTWDDTQAFCDWVGNRLPLPVELVEAPLPMPSGACREAWVAGGTANQKQLVAAGTGQRSGIKPRTFSAPTLGFATAPLPTVNRRGLVWVGGTEKLPAIDLPKLHALAGRYKVPFVFVTPIARSAGADQPVPGFWIDSDCITNEDYWEFARMSTVRYPRHWSKEWMPRWGQPFPLRLAHCPVVNVRFDEALAYVRWKNSRLPSLEQRRWATQYGHGGAYPWGADYSAERCNSIESGRGELARIDEFADGASALGVRQLSGNNWEWIVGPAGQPLLCGGSYGNPCEFWGVAGAYLDPQTLPVAPELIGFRMARK
jgi:Uncharacterized conserved protein